ncbi:WD domain, g-beta repeat domain-containing protein [Trichoderma breve]|uniref:WD domain, g-beta repeat domain-containing protein n=1 Tax=Trichoderma breve TaxID=2034170 RepID=A0A9W9EDI1_9HYPO|nr:WD domain, g-beta repeat domain-containing protein [Trichoderma breve]KAJ4864716.1 WD domain, g-beta repeat domain-containing protein [Trichoderma breve]
MKKFTKLFSNDPLDISGDESSGRKTLEKALHHLLGHGHKESTTRQTEAHNTSAAEMNITGIPPTHQLAPSDDAAALTQVKREHLWDEAYDNLRLVHPELVGLYEEILSLEIEAMATEPSMGRISRTEHMKTSISQSDIKDRWHQMCHLLNWWLDNRNRGWSSRQGNQLRDLLRDHVRRSTGGKSPCALVWVCVCYASRVLLHPSSKTEAVCTGLLDIIAKMNWYNCLPRIIVSGDTGELLEGEQVLRERVVDLYSEILSYLMNAALPAGCQFDAWDSNSARLKVAEDHLSTFSGSLVVQQLDEFLKLEREKENRQLSPRNQETMSLTSEIGQKLARLGRISAESSVIEARNENGLLAHELCQWICSTEQYKSVVNWNTKGIEKNDSGQNDTGSITSHVLLISGGQGVNKTALMEAIVRRLSNEINLEKTDVSKGGSKAIYKGLSYYSCGRTSHGTDSSASVLRSLIHSLLQQQPKLISHLDNALSRTERNGFDSPKDFFALSAIFFNMLDDQAFVRSYIVIDGINQCSSSHGRDSGEDLGDLMRLIEATADVPHKIKWLLSTDMDAHAEFELIREGHYQCINLGGTTWTPGLAGIFRRNLVSIVGQLAKQRRYPEQIKEEFLRLIGIRSRGNALWIFVACSLLRKEESWYAVEALKEMPERLDELYDYARANLRKLPRQDPIFCESVLSTVAIVHRPLLVSELVLLADLPPEVDPLAIIEKCSLLEVHSGIVKFVDPTARHNTWEELHQDLARFSDAHSIITRRALRFLSAHFETATLRVTGINSGQDQNKEESFVNAYGTTHWIMHLLDVKDIAKDIETTSLVVSFIQNHFLLWLDGIISNGLQADTLMFMKKLESVPLEQAREEKKEPLKTQDFKQPQSEIPEQLAENEQGHILSLVQGCVQAIRSHMSSDSIFSTNPNSVIFYPEESALRQDWVAKNKSWLIMPPKMAQSWGDSSLTLAGQSRIRSIAFSPDGKLLVSGSDSEAIRVWDAETGEAQITLNRSGDCGYYVTFSSNGELVCVSDKGIIYLYQLKTGRGFKTLTVYGRKVTAIRFSPNGGRNERLVLGTLTALLLVDVSDLGKRECKCTHKVLEEGDPVYAVDFSRQGTWIASGGKGGDIKIWDARHDNAIQRTLQGHEGDVKSVTFSRDEKRLVSGSDDLTVKIWSVETGANLKSFGCEHIICEVTFSSDDSVIAAASGNQIKVWESESGAQRHVMIGHEKPVTAVAFSSQGRLASGSDDMTLRLWSPEGSVSNDRSTLSELGNEKPINFIAMSPDGKYLASSSRDNIHLWDGTTVSSSRDGTVGVWDVATGTKCRTFKAHTHWVITVAFSPDGRLLASGGLDSKIIIWDRKSLERKGEMTDHSDGVINIIFSQDSSRIVSRSKDFTFCVWDSNTGALIQGPMKALNPNRYIGFDLRIPEYFLTEYEVDLSTLNPSPFPVQEGQKVARYGVGPRGDWITWNGKNIIPIPKAYKPTASWVQGNIVAIGTRLGEMLLFRFSTEVEPPN